MVSRGLTGRRVERRAGRGSGVSGRWELLHIVLHQQEESRGGYGCLWSALCKYVTEELHEVVLKSLPRGWRERDEACPTGWGWVWQQLINSWTWPQRLCCSARAGFAVKKSTPATLPIVRGSAKQVATAVAATTTTITATTNIHYDSDNNICHANKTSNTKSLCNNLNYETNSKPSANFLIVWITHTHIHKNIPWLCCSSLAFWVNFYWRNKLVKPKRCKLYDNLPLLPCSEV